jgi:hypothetical protein
MKTLILTITMMTFIVAIHRTDSDTQTHDILINDLNLTGKKYTNYDLPKSEDIPWELDKKEVF